MFNFSSHSPILFFFFFNDTATTEIYTLSLHDALPISDPPPFAFPGVIHGSQYPSCSHRRSEEHTSELQSRLHLVCRLLLEKKKKSPTVIHTETTKTRFYSACGSQHIRSS